MKVFTDILAGFTFNNRVFVFQQMFNKTIKNSVVKMKVARSSFNDVLFLSLFFFVILLHESICTMTKEEKRKTQYTGPGHGIDAHVADRARLSSVLFQSTLTGS